LKLIDGKPPALQENNPMAHSWFRPPKATRIKRAPSGPSNACMTYGSPRLRLDNAGNGSGRLLEALAAIFQPTSSTNAAREEGDRLCVQLVVRRNLFRGRMKRE
jgi:hypothetical protein